MLARKATITNSFTNIGADVSERKCFYVTPVAVTDVSALHYTVTLKVNEQVYKALSYIIIIYLPFTVFRSVYFGKKNK